MSEYLAGEPCMGLKIIQMKDMFQIRTMWESGWRPQTCVTQTPAAHGEEQQVLALIYPLSPTWHAHSSVKTCSVTRIGVKSSKKARGPCQNKSPPEWQASTVCVTSACLRRKDGLSGAGRGPKMTGHWSQRYCRYSFFTQWPLFFFPVGSKGKHAGWDSQSFTSPKGENSDSIKFTLELWAKVKHYRQKRVDFIISRRLTEGHGFFSNLSHSGVSRSFLIPVC